MRWRKRDLWKAGVVVGGVLFLVLMTLVTVSVADARGGVSGASSVGTVTVQATPTVDATMTVLQKQQLILQNKQLQQSEDRGFSTWLWNNAAAIVASFLSTLVVVIGALIGFWQWRTNRNDVSRKESVALEDVRLREEKAAERESKDRQAAQDKELRDRAEERFQTAVAALGSENPATQIGGATLLRSFFHEEDKKLYERYYTQIFDLAVSHLRLRHVDPDTPEPLDALTQALATVFKEAFPLARDLLKLDPLDLDAIRVQLDGAYLARSDLSHVRLPEAYLRKVNFYGANLSEANLREAKLRYASFADADLTKTYLVKADLREAVLTGILLNLAGANLDGADLTGARLDGTKILAARSLNNTDLRGVKGLDDKQKAACKAKGAIVDEDSLVSASQTPATPSPPSQQSS